MEDHKSWKQMGEGQPSPPPPPAKPLRWVSGTAERQCLWPSLVQLQANEVSLIIQLYTCQEGNNSAKPRKAGGHLSWRGGGVPRQNKSRGDNGTQNRDDPGEGRRQTQRLEGGRRKGEFSLGRVVERGSQLLHTI